MEWNDKEWVPGLSVYRQHPKALEAAGLNPAAFGHLPREVPVHIPRRGRVYGDLNWDALHTIDDPLASWEAVCGTCHLIHRRGDCEY